MIEKRQSKTVLAVEHCLQIIFYVNHFSGL
jgi:hypothetical protein